MIRTQHISISIFGVHQNSESSSLSEMYGEICTPTRARPRFVSIAICIQHSFPASFHSAEHAHQRGERISRNKWIFAFKRDNMVGAQKSTIRLTMAADGDTQKFIKYFSIKILRRDYGVGQPRENGWLEHFKTRCWIFKTQIVCHGGK